MIAVVWFLTELACLALIAAGLLLAVVAIADLFDDPARRADRDHVTRCYRNGGWE